MRLPIADWNSGIRICPYFNWQLAIGIPPRLGVGGAKNYDGSPP
jgi:hypothetical protein